MSPLTGGASGRAAPQCPICGAACAPRWRPFCSRRCADVDLGRWLKEAYRIPSAEAADADEEAGAEAPAPDG